MLNFLQTKLRHTIVLTGLAATAGVLTLGGAGCTSFTNETSPAGPASCPTEQFFDSRTGTCVTPASHEEAKVLATRGDLEQLRDSGDPTVLVEIKLTSPISRTAFSTLIQRISPDSVDKIGLFFPVIAGGFAPVAQTSGAPTNTTDLVNRARLVVTARYNAMSDSTLQPLAAQFDAAFVQEEEQYSILRLRAKPSRLLQAWNTTEGIAYIAVQRTAQ